MNIHVSLLADIIENMLQSTRHLDDVPSSRCDGTHDEAVFRFPFSCVLQTGRRQRQRGTSGVAAFVVSLK